MEILAEAVRFFAGGRQILQGIDLELRPKEFFRYYRAERQREEHLPEMRLPTCRNRQREKFISMEKN